MHFSTLLADFSAKSLHKVPEDSRNFVISKVFNSPSFLPPSRVILLSFLFLFFPSFPFSSSHWQRQCRTIIPWRRILQRGGIREDRMFADFARPSREYPVELPAAEKLIFRIDGRQNCHDLLAGKRPVKIYGRDCSPLSLSLSLSFSLCVRSPFCVPVRKMFQIRVRGGRSYFLFDNLPFPRFNRELWTRRRPIRFVSTAQEIPNARARARASNEGWMRLFRILSYFRECNLKIYCLDRKLSCATGDFFYVLFIYLCLISLFNLCGYIECNCFFF